MPFPTEKGVVRCESKQELCCDEAVRKLLSACVPTQILYAAPGSLCLPVKSLNMYFCLLSNIPITHVPQDMDR